MLELHQPTAASEGMEPTDHLLPYQPTYTNLLGLMESISEMLSTGFMDLLLSTHAAKSYLLNQGITECLRLELSAYANTPEMNFPNSASFERTRKSQG